MAHSHADISAVQSRLQELVETLPASQAQLLEAVVARTPLEVRADPGAEDDDRSIIVVGGRGGRWLVFDVSDVVAELNPQPLPPGPDLDRQR